MKISELATKLLDMRDAYGDMDIVFHASWEPYKEIEITTVFGLSNGEKARAILASKETTGPWISL